MVKLISLIVCMAGRRDPFARLLDSLAVQTSTAFEASALSVPYVS